MTASMYVRIHYSPSSCSNTSFCHKFTASAGGAAAPKTGAGVKDTVPSAAPSTAAGASSKAGSSKGKGRNHGARQGVSTFCSPFVVFVDLHLDLQSRGGRNGHGQH